MNVVLKNFGQYREDEGKVMEIDLCSRIVNILEYFGKLDFYEVERVI